MTAQAPRQADGELPVSEEHKVHSAAQSLVDNAYAEEVEWLLAGNDPSL